MIRTLTAPPKRTLPFIVRYGASFALVAAATVATMQGVELLEPMRFVLFWVAVVTATLIGGTGAGLFGVALSVIAAATIEFPWHDITSGRDPVDTLRILLFAAFASMLTIAVGLRDAANRRVDVLREWLGTTLNSIGDGVIVTDPDGKVIFLNPVAAATTGWHADDAYDRSVQEVFNVRREETLEAAEHPVGAALAKQRAVLLDEKSVLLTRDGRVIPIDDSAAPVKSSDGTLRGVVLVFRDDTKRREAEKALQQADRAKDLFLATLSHDLRTPLTAILGWTRLLREGGLDASTQQEGLDTIEQNASAQAALIEDILDLTRIASGKISIDRAEVDFGAIVKESVNGLQPVVAEKGSALQLRLNAPRTTVSGDAKRLRQIVWNLVSNAIKFSPEGSTIEVEVNGDTSTVEMKVIDHGIGIDSSVLPRVFERFRQAHGDHSVKLGGLGLGLAIVKDLAELHGGTVSAWSAGAGTGSTFKVRLPISAARA